MIKNYVLVLLMTFFASLSQAQRLNPNDGNQNYDKEHELPSNNSSTGPANTVTATRSILRRLNPNNPSNSVTQPDNSGDWGFTNLRLSAGTSYTSFDNSEVGSSGHFRDYNLSLSGDITENDTITFGVSQTRYETGNVGGILARTQGLNLTWVHNLTENYGIGVLGYANQVDIEETNGNSYSYGYGLLFTTFHSFKYFNLSSATTVTHSEFDLGYDQFLMSAWTLTKPWTDKFSTYLTLTYNDSFKSDPDTDPTYGSWEVGVNYIFTDNLSANLAFARTEFLNNYSDNGVIFNITWQF